jgi:hypothetical protein
MDRTIYAVTHVSHSPALGAQIYSCGLKGHIIIMAKGSNGLSRLADTQQPTNSAGHQSLLNSWKEIAAYLGRGVRTTQRWETNLGMPVHRLQTRNRSAVVAFADELDGWLRQTPVRLLSRKSPGSVLPDRFESRTA